MPSHSSGPNLAVYVIHINVSHTHKSALGLQTNGTAPTVKAVLKQELVILKAFEILLIIF